jgi:hypothetical protein
MTYWRMQLHPGKRASRNAVQYTVESLAAHVIGFELTVDVGDLSGLTTAALNKSDRHCLPFATEMKTGDNVLIFAHNFPFALCRVSGDYEYVRERKPGLWFRHSRQVDDVWYYGDYIKDPHAWEEITMRPAFQRVLPPKQPSFLLIERWLAHGRRLAANA